MGDTEQRIDSVRKFNRFYTRRIGVLEEGHLGSSFSLAEVRVLYELEHRDQPAAAELARDLGLDGGYLSRLLAGLRRRGLVGAARSRADGRRSLLSLTSRGRKVFAGLDRSARNAVESMIGALSRNDQNRLVGAMAVVEKLLDNRPITDSSYLLRPHRPGDLGWLIHRHGVLYAEEYGYDEQFEALVAQIAAEFLQRFDPKRERCWIAERDGENVGAVLLVKQSRTVAKLRLLLVEPSARGLGIGSRLIEECIRFARQADYRMVALWTQSELHAARRLYERAGFRLKREEPHHSFGRDLVAEIWETKL
jgi:DNA-binding MarR family transcriptional regulator/GNAT superfamily N-acetyltransferase